MLYFQNERHHKFGNLKRDLFLGHLQLPLDKNSADLVILILEFDNVTVKTIYCFLSSLKRDPGRCPVGGPVLYCPCSRRIKISLQFHAVKLSLSFKHFYHLHC